MQRDYVVATHVGMQRLVCAGLERQGFDHLLPLVTERWAERGKIRERKSPAFGPYVIVSFDVNRDPWRSINGTRGVVRLLPYSNEVPTPLPIDFVPMLRMRADLAAKDGGLTYDEVADVMLDYIAGDEVPVVGGTFAGETGTFKWQRARNVTIFLSVLGRRTEVTLPAHQVQRPASQALR